MPAPTSLNWPKRSRPAPKKSSPKTARVYIAVIDADRLDYYHQLEHERIHLLLIDEAAKGLDDIAAGRVKDARSAIHSIKRRRNA